MCPLAPVLAGARASRVWTGAFAVTVVAACGSAGPLAPEAHAQQEPTVVSADARLVTFDYDPERTYLVLTRPKVVTHVQLGPTETVSTVVVGDTANFSVVLSTNRRHLLVRPKYEGLTTSVTLITNEREYPLILRSTKEGSGKWYQRVSWTTPVLELEEFEETRARSPLGLERQASLATRPKQGPGLPPESGSSPSLPDASQSSQSSVEGSPLSPQASSVNRIRLDLIRTNYTIEGKADFKPWSVFDDGSKTFIRLPDQYQNFPAVFAWSNEQTQLVNYSVEQHYIVVQGVHAGLLLKLGKAEVKITKESEHASSWFGARW